MQRLESTRQVYISLAGSELTLAMVLARFGIPAAYITRVPDNPYGWLVRDTARSQGINTDYFVWASKAEPVGRFLYELGRTPRKSVGYYQRMYSAASRLGAGHGGLEGSACATAGCSTPPASAFGLSTHSKYERNYLLEAFLEAVDEQTGGLPGGDGFQLPRHLVDTGAVPAGDDSRCSSSTWIS